MDTAKMNHYEACDKAIKAMDRENVELFGQLKMVKWDDVNIIRTVTAVYQKSAKSARKRYFQVAFEAYLLGLVSCGTDMRTAHRMAEKAITMVWVDEKLDQADAVTMYKFYAETERKAYKLAETLEVTPDRRREIDRALKYWSQQLGQYAINVTDYATIQSFDDAGVEMVKWMSEREQRTCNECYALNGQVFYIDEIPQKPHLGCRCFWKAVFREKTADEVEADKS